MTAGVMELSGCQGIKMVNYDSGGNKILYEDGKRRIIESRDGRQQLPEGNRVIAWYVPGIIVMLLI